MFHNFHHLLFTHSVQHNLSKFDNIVGLTKEICSNLIKFRWKVYVRVRNKKRKEAEAAAAAAAALAATKKKKKDGKKKKKSKKKKKKKTGDEVSTKTGKKGKKKLL